MGGPDAQPSPQGDVVSGNKLVTQELSYKALDVSSPVYQLQKTLPQGSSQTVSVAPGGMSSEIVFDIPSKVINFAQSTLVYDTTIAAQGANTYAWQYQDCFSEIERIQLVTQAGLALVDVQFAHKYQRVFNYLEQRFVDIKMNDSVEKFYLSNLPAAQNPLPINAGSATATVNYSEPQYLAVSGANAALSQTNLQLKLSRFFNTLLAYNKDIYFPEALQLKVTFSALTAGFQGTSNVNPATGAALLADPGGAGYALQINNLRLYLATETRADIIQSVKAQTMAGMNHVVGWVKAAKDSITGTSQAQTVIMTRGDGKFVDKIVHTVWNPTESGQTLFDQGTGATAGNAATNYPNGKITSFQTAIDDSYLQQEVINVYPSVKQDWLYQKQYFKGSPIQSATMYQNHWMWIDSFKKPSSAEEKYKEAVNTYGGLELPADRNRKYMFQATVPLNGAGTSATFTHISWIVLQRVLHIGPDGIAFV